MFSSQKTSLLVDRDRKGELVHEIVVNHHTDIVAVTDCGSSENDVINIVFEDDVVLSKDFGARVLDAFASVPDDWDMLLLNWYCNAQHWKECKKNNGGKERFVAEHLVRVKFFMSGSGYAVSRQGAAKLLQVRQ